MQWFGGKVDEAVKQIKKNGEILLVYVQDSSDVSSNILQNFDEKSLASQCLNIVQDTPVAVQFNAVYKITKVPCIYIISSAGSLLGTKVDDFSTESLKKWIASISGVSSGDDVKPSTSHSNEIIKPDIKEISEQRNIEFERECQKDELERRKHCKNLQSLKEMQHEQEMLERINQQKEDRLQNKLDSERIKRLIEEDRKEKEYRRKMLEFSSADSTESPENTRLRNLYVPDNPILSDETRIQIRMCSGQGGHVVKVFKSNEGVFDCINGLFSSIINGTSESDGILVSDLFKEQLIHASRSGYDLEQMRPPRRFTTDDAHKNFMELQLCPSAVILVRPKSYSSSTPGGGVIQTVPNMLGTVIYSTWNLIYWVLNSVYRTGYGMFNGSNNNANDNQDNINRGHRGKRPSLNDNSNNSQSTSKDSHLTSSGKKKYARTIQQGSINRLSHMPDDSDEENARWNGNSTSQL